MRTFNNQTHDLIDLIKKLEAKIAIAEVYSDAYEQVFLYKQLDNAKSTLLNISND